MTAMIAFALAAAAPQANLLPEKDGLVLVYGVGLASCASAWSRQRSAEAYTWLMGFWSAVNLIKPSDAKFQSDGDGVAAEVRKTCSAEPSLTLMVAARDTYNRLAIAHSRR